MIGILAVSHSAKLAAAAVELADEMAPDALVRIAAGAGMDPDGKAIIGTDAALVAAELEALADAGASGIAVIMDLGSALMSAEMGVEFACLAIDVRLTAAPFVEGLIAAAVAAAGGASLDTVVQEARSALDAKADQLGEAEAPAREIGAPAAAEGEETAVVRVAITDPHGLHARPVSQLVKAVGQDHVTVIRVKTGQEAAANSMVRVLTLGAQSGEDIDITAHGENAQAIVDRVAAAFRAAQG